MKRSCILILCLGILATFFAIGPRPAFAQSCTSSDGHLTVNPCAQNVTIAINSNAQKKVVFTDNQIRSFVKVLSCAQISGPVGEVSCAYAQHQPDPEIDSVTMTLTVTTQGGVATVSILGQDTVAHSFVSATVQVTVAQADTMSLAFNNQAMQSMRLCKQSCFAATVSAATVPYFSLDQPQGVSLFYDADNLQPRPFVYADVQTTLGSPSPSKWTLEVFNGAAHERFTNGDTVLYFGSASSGRLAGQFVLDSSTATGVYQFTVVATGIWSSGGTYKQTGTMNVLVENERTSPIARGWTVAGVQHLYPITTVTGALVTDGAGSMVLFTGCTTNCTYTSPPGEFSVLSTSGTGASQTYTRKYADSSYVIFNNLGQLRFRVDAYANATVLGYDTQGRLIKIYDPWRVNPGDSSAYIQLSYGTNGLSSVTEPDKAGNPGAGRSTAFSVASDGTLSSVTDPDAFATQYLYDAHKRLKTVVNRRGDSTVVGYDTLAYKLTSLSSLHVPVDVGGGSTHDSTVTAKFTPWQTSGVPTTSTSSGSPAPFPGAMVATVTDPAGHATQFTVNQWGEPVTTTNALGGQSSIFYPAGSPMPDTITSTLGGSSLYAFAGSVVTSVQPSGALPTHFRYNSGFAEPDSIWGGGVAPQRRFIGQSGRVDSVRIGGSSSRMLRFTYDLQGRMLSATDMLGHLRQMHYDANFGNLDSVTVSGGRWSKTIFDAAGRDSVVRRGGLATVTITYDKWNRVTKVVDSISGNPTTTLAYDGLYRTHVTDPAGHVYKYDADPLGRVTHQYDVADTTKFIANRYSADGMLTGQTNRRGQAIAMTFDGLHRPLSVTGTNVVADSFSYNVAGTRVVRWNAAARDSLFADTTGWTDSIITRLAGISTDSGARFRYTPDSVHRLATLKIGSSANGPFFPTRTLTFDPSLGVLTQIQLAGRTAYSTSVTYSNALMPTGLTYPGPTSGHQAKAIVYTAIGAAYQQQFSGSSVLDNAMNQKFGYDTAERINTSIPVDVSRSAWNDIQYAYDGLGRLVARRNADPGTLCPSDTTSGYQCSTLTTADSLAYDGAGNLNGGTINGSSVSATYGAGNRPSSLMGVSHTFDADGNVTSNGSRQFFWSAIGLLDSVTAGSVTLHYQYDAGGRLVERSRNGTLERGFYWDGADLVAEVAPISSTEAKRIGEYVYWPGGMSSPFAYVSGAETLAGVSYYMQDAIGNVDGVFRSDSAGSQSIQEQYAYNVLGAQTLSIDSATGSRLTWKGLVYESDSTRLYYVRGRWYDPQQGRFMSEDPLSLGGGGPHLYAFAGDDPINGRDPTGLDDEEDPGSGDQADPADPSGPGDPGVGNGPPTLTGIAIWASRNTDWAGFAQAVSDFFAWYDNLFGSHIGGSLSLAIQEAGMKFNEQAVEFGKCFGEGALDYAQTTAAVTATAAVITSLAAFGSGCLSGFVIGGEVGTLAGPAGTIGGALGGCFLGGGIAAIAGATEAVTAGVAIGGAAYAATGFDVARKCLNP